MPDHFAVELCKLVQRYPEIYDIGHERFHSDEAKKNAWKTIARDLGLQQPSKCEIKWKFIKHQFVKARKENNTAWELWPFLGFLQTAAERSSPGKSSQKGAIKRSATKTAGSNWTSLLRTDKLIVMNEGALECATAGKPLHPLTLTIFHEPPAPKTTPVLPTGSAKEPDVLLIIPPSIKRRLLKKLELGEAIQEQLAGSSKAEAPSPKHPRTQRSSFGADDKGPSGMNCASTLHLKFFEQVQERFMRLKPEVVWTMKATILSMLDNAAKS
ncbi:uncharacterized protein LOC119461345 isoform X3 [Dermacentor silvarum]|uniref:uncharacterized protein LOC119461345 isoform X3 n=1 Tax=Dermacentor silvarum TaxID=543639 RepID=UPI0021012D94|nr:uncharacterized protein LOC119461345 isoform X3 [Dermacentor silvarum]